MDAEQAVIIEPAPWIRDALGTRGLHCPESSLGGHEIGQIEFFSRYELECDIYLHSKSPPIYRLDQIHPFTRLINE
jgi:hypothetical protein